MTFRVTVICLLTIFLFTKAGLAAKYELEEKRGLIMLQGFTQWASLSYEYSASRSSANTNSFHYFQERYNFSTDIALVDPLLLQLNLGGSLGLDQSLSYNTVNSASSHKLDYQYNLSGNALSGGWHPVAFNSSYLTNTVVSPFTPTYTTSTSANGMKFTFLGKPLETTFSYQKTSVDTSGSSLNSTSNTEQFSFGAVHKYKDTSSTGINASCSLLSGSGIDTILYLVNLNNTLIFGPSRTLTTALQWQSQAVSGIHQESLNLAERYHAVLGKALVSETSYQYQNTDTTDFSGNRQASSSQAVSTSLQHRLYESLTTTMSGGAGINNYLGGQEDRYFGTLSLQYHKRLVPGSVLTSGASESYEQVQRNLAGSDLAVRDEQHTVGQQGDFFVLGTSGTLKSVVGITSKNPDISYLEGRDYSVDANIRRITIVQGGTIAPGTVLFISYILTVDPSISYGTNTLSLTSNLSWSEGKYNLSALLSQSSVSQLSGQSQAGLNSTRIGMLRFQSMLERVNYGLEYGSYLSGSTSYQYFDGSWLYKYQLPNAIFSLVERDRYTVYGATSNIGAYGENTFSTTSSYTRLFTWGQGNLAVSFADSRGGLLSNDYFYLSGSIRSQINKLVVDLNGQTVYRIRGTQKTMDNSVNLNLVRYF